MTSDRYTLPPSLPVPLDDGAADRLPGTRIPPLVLDSSHGPADLAELASERLVLYVYPRAGRPGRPSPPGWDEIPGAARLHAAVVWVPRPCRRARGARRECRRRLPRSR